MKPQVFLTTDIRGTRIGEKNHRCFLRQKLGGTRIDKETTGVSYHRRKEGHELMKRQYVSLEIEC